MGNILFRKTLAATVIGLGLAVAGAGMAHAADYAPRSPSGGNHSTTINAGATSSGHVSSVLIGNPEVPESTGAATSPYQFTATVTFTAPEHATFADATVRHTTNDGESFVMDTQLTNCVLSNANTVVTCTDTYTIPGRVAGSNGSAAAYFYSPRLTADVDAPDGTFTTTAALSFDDDPYLQDGSRPSSVTLVAAEPTPMIDPAVGGTAAAVVALGGTAVFVARRRHSANEQSGDS